MHKSFTSKQKLLTSTYKSLTSTPKPSPNRCLLPTSLPAPPTFTHSPTRYRSTAPASSAAPTITTLGTFSQSSSRNVSPTSSGFSGSESMGPR